eukprot:CAMPEP_0119103612 /NCGR_PEP_ID=MMETSP1180-20130426/2020_1 /TAXON_ID=3052 ORGANISM="Chlamydomonas cf sp, Strain CCMP681" /NCGR_SAMPLE_ID=MMETSP1180 /ASSEMBLY_ACC=CAM_ASM_000741 /LENGTH=185 /DNA_ID=CAMNT_0007088165 /DNA_START=21 /DNA_END=578 /DNA_ORIENTATION=-
MLVEGVEGVEGPSTISYRSRLHLREADGHSYARLYSTSRSQDVFGRLVSDAGGRQLRSSQGFKPRGMAWPDYAPPGPFYSEGELSGFITNTSKAVYTHTTFRTGRQKDFVKPDLDRMVPRQLKRYMAREPFDYASIVRPDAETTNQALRMLGTYASDEGFARRAGQIIPNCSPGGTGWHPDVRQA